MPGRTLTNVSPADREKYHKAMKNGVHEGAEDYLYWQNYEEFDPRCTSIGKSDMRDDADDDPEANNAQDWEG